MNNETITLSIERYEELLKKAIVYDLYKKSLDGKSYIDSEERLLFEVKKNDEEK